MPSEVKLNRTRVPHDPSQSQPLTGAKILVLSRYTAAGPSSRLRFHQYVPALERAGARVSCSPLLSDGYVRRLFDGGGKAPGAIAWGIVRRLADLAVRRPDLVWIEKELFPYLPGAFERLAGWLRAPIVVDFDDAIFHNYDMSGSAVMRRMLGRKLDPLLSRAALVTAGNAYLADYATAHGAGRIMNLPTVIDLDAYPLLPPPGGTELRVGWIGTPANAAYLAPVVTALAKVASRQAVRLITIGAGDWRAAGVPHEALAWDQATEGRALAGIDIGIMPLADGPWERGKCGYKLIQYMAAGRPVVASAVGANRAIITPDVGLLIDGDDRWADALAMLATDPGRRHDMGQAARTRAADRYSVQATAPRLIAAFASLLGR